LETLNYDLNEQQNLKYISFYLFIVIIMSVSTRNNRAEVIEDFNDIMRIYDPATNKTKNILSKYERVKIIGLRSEQLQRGADPYVEVDTTKEFNPRQVAAEELRQKKLPFMIKRTMPDGSFEYWRLDDMIIL
jgi:DNA-directed RNA polymerase I, II, and III subunit RPABC2